MASKLDAQLIKALGEKGLISAADEKAYLDEAAKSKEGLYALLLKRQAAPEDTLLKCLAEITHVSVIDLPSVQADPEVLQKVPLKIAEYYKIVPIRIEKRKLTIAVSGPLDLRVQDDMRAHLGFEIEVNYAREKDVQEAIKRFYGFAAGTIGEMVAAQAQTKQPVAPPPSEQAYEKIENIDKLVGDASIAKLVNQIILEAYRKRATDIHLEPYRGKVKLRYRIDGILYNANVQPEINRFIQPILSRIKIMSNLNIVERRLPQDGRAIVKVEDTTLDLRVSSIPTPYGESVVIRMLPMNRIFNLSQLGLAPRQQHIFEDLVKLPHGVIFITGPTGSGKSTTLYACLNKMNSDDRKIITIEDPVEYEMEGVTQIQVQSEIGLTFARGLRSMLRHDPDVMMVGEVRDLETAEIAIRVALTGHLVFSTLHTNDAASGVTRLIDIGVEPYLVASSLQAFIAQRLIRVICPKCKAEDKSPLNNEFKRQIARELGLKKESAVTIHHGKGCNECNNTGFWGRVAIYEVLLFNEKVKELVMKRATAGEIKRAAIASGMKTLRQDGWQKVVDGVTTPEEVLKVVEHDREEEEAIAALTGEKKAPVLSGPRSWLTGDEPDVPRFEDRRLFVRLGHNVNVRYKIVKYKDAARKPGVAEEFTVTRNLSAGGVMFAAKESIPVGTILELKIELPSDDKAVECLARVIREEEVEPEKSYDLAACFLDLSSADRSRLEKYIERGERT